MVEKSSGKRNQRDFREEKFVFRAFEIFYFGKKFIFSGKKLREKEEIFVK